MGPNSGASDYPPRARSERQRWPAGAHQLRAGRPSQPGLSSDPFGPSVRAGPPRCSRPGCCRYGVDHGSGYLAARPLAGQAARLVAESSAAAERLPGSSRRLRGAPPLARRQRRALPWKARATHAGPLLAQESPSAGLSARAGGVRRCRLARRLAVFVGHGPVRPESSVPRDAQMPRRTPAGTGCWASRLSCGVCGWGGRHTAPGRRRRTWPGSPSPSGGRPRRQSCPLPDRRFAAAGAPAPAGPGASSRWE
jgi:hypothetical protein